MGKWNGSPRLLAVGFETVNGNQVRARSERIVVGIMAVRGFQNGLSYLWVYYEPGEVWVVELRISWLCFCVSRNCYIGYQIQTRVIGSEIPRTPHRGSLFYPDFYLYYYEASTTALAAVCIVFAHSQKAQDFTVRQSGNSTR